MQEKQGVLKKGVFFTERTPMIPVMESAQTILRFPIEIFDRNKGYPEYLIAYRQTAETTGILKSTPSSRVNPPVSGSLGVQPVRTAHSHSTSHQNQSPTATVGTRNHCERIPIVRRSLRWSKNRSFHFNQLSYTRCKIQSFFCLQYC